jgi:hypothetical protein
MRYRSYTQYRRGKKGTGGIQLFPFLAVLMCTMGTLILLMVILSRQARVQAAQAAGQEMAQRNAEEARDQKRIRWRIEQLQIARGKTEAQLAESRLALGHLEDHSRRLRDQLAGLEKTLAELDRTGAADQQKHGALASELANLRKKIAEADRQVAAAEAEAAGRSRSYAVVPYEGPNQTRRRPLYLECRADTVVIQPEGIRLTSEDFEGPMGPGNPLSVALRTEREYLMRQPGYRPERDGEPYPLMLVRPEGIEAYYAARAALHDWGAEFGYELVGADWKLAFPAANEALAREMQKAVDTARESQRMRIASMGRQHASRLRPTYRVAPSHGGVVLDSGSPEEDSSSGGGFAEHRPYIQPGNDDEDGSGSGGGGSSQQASDKAFVAGVNNPYLDAEKKAAAGAGQGPGGVGRGGIGQGRELGTQGSGVGDQGSGALGSGLAGQNRTQTGTGFSGQNSGGGTQGSGTGAENSSVGTANSGSRPGLLSNGGGNAGANSLSTGEGTPGGASGSNLVQSDIAAAGASANKAQANASAKGAGSNCPNAIAQPGSTGAKGGEPLKLGQWEESPPLPKDPKELKKLESLAKKRGKDWGLLDKSREASPVTRPIAVVCWPDRLEILSDPAAQSGKVIPLGPHTETSVDTFVSALWDLIKGWGIAGRSMYWRPVLKVQVAPGAEGRFRDLQNLLEGSGFVVEKK